MNEIKEGHPCFDETAHFRVGRIHLPVAPRCNVSCAYCQREINRTSARPGVAATIMTPAQALAWTSEVVASDPTIKIVGVAGPGDALANKATMETLALVHDHFPHLQKCLSTNGLLLADYAMDLVAIGVTTISVTVNAVDREIGRHFYDRIFLGGSVHGEDAFDHLSERQLSGIEAAVKAGIIVKVNAVLVPELNGHHLLDVARAAADRGAALMNIMALKPLSRMAAFRPPDCRELELARESCERIIPQFKSCRQCRADAVGIPGRPDLDFGSVPSFH